MFNPPAPTAFDDSADRGSPAAEGPEGRLPLLVCFSHLRWDFVFQRPQHLMTRAARTHRVLFIEEPVWAAEMTPRMQLRETPQGVTVAVPVLPSGMRDDADVATATTRLVSHLLAAHPAPTTVHWYYTPAALKFTALLDADVVVYDCMDELSAFRGAAADLRELEQQLFARADLVFTGGRSLFEAKRRQHPKVMAFPSSVDAAHFAGARAGATDEPRDQAGFAHPRAGFFGVVDERMDLDFVGRLAALRPELQLVFLGPVVKIDPASLPQAGNIHWLGFKEYAELPAYLAGWDVALMPFALNAATEFISPTKTLEFLAAGVPVVSAAITDVVRPYGQEGLVEIVASPEAAAVAIDMLLTRRREPWLAQVDAMLATTSWERTWDDMSGAIARQLHQTREAALPRVAAHV